MSGDHNMYAGGGGPAFPATHFDLTDDEHGMTLRDYFAAKALQGMLAENGGGAASNDKLAQWSYQIADAMLEARKT